MYLYCIALHCIAFSPARVVAGGVASDVEGCPVNSGYAPEKSVSAVGNARFT